MRHLRVAFATGVVAVGIAVFTAGAAGSPDGRWFTGMSLRFTGPTTTAGTFVMSGAVRDSGTSHVANLALVPIGQSGLSRLSGDQTYVGSRGTIVTHFEGKAFGDPPHMVGRGRVEIISGTGAYAGLEGRARFLIVVDAASNQLIGTATGSVNG